MALLGTLGVNILARNHVHAMTHFVAEGERTAPPEHLSWIESLEVLALGVTIPRPSNTVHPAVPFTTHRVPVGVDGAEAVEVWRAEVADPIGEAILFHGYAGSKDSLVPLIADFHDRGLSVVLVDFRGSGGSDGNSHTLGVREAEDVRAVVRWAAATHDRPRVLYGFSMGGTAVLRALSLEALPVDAVVVEAVFDRLRTTLGHRFERFGLPAFPGADLLMIWGSIDLWTNAYSVAPSDYAARVDVRTWVLGGEADPRVLPEEARAVADALPDSQFVLRSGGHLFSAKADPTVWKSVLDAVRASAPFTGSSR